MLAQNVAKKELWENTPIGMGMKFGGLFIAKIAVLNGMRFILFLIMKMSIIVKNWIFKILDTQIKL